MKPEGRRHQAVMQVKVWSPEIANVLEVDLLQRRENSIATAAMGEDVTTSAGSKATV